MKKLFHRSMKASSASKASIFSFITPHKIKDINIHEFSVKEKIVQQWNNDVTLNTEIDNGKKMQGHFAKATCADIICCD